MSQALASPPNPSAVKAPGAGAAAVSAGADGKERRAVLLGMDSAADGSQRVKGPVGQAGGLLIGDEARAGWGGQRANSGTRGPRNG